MADWTESLKAFDPEAVPSFFADNAADGRAIVVESSANLRSCNNIEQFTLTHSQPLLDFHRQWLDEVIATAAASKVSAPKKKAKR